MDERVVLGVSAAHTRMELKGFGAVPASLSGLLYGVEGRATLWHVQARGEYRQGHLDRSGTGLPSGDVIVARASIGIQPLPWLAVTAGPRYSRVKADDGNRHELRWRVELHGSGPLVPGLVRGFASVSGSVAGKGIDWGEPSGGGELGVMVGGIDRPLWARLGYRMDREYLSGASREAVETVYLAIGVAVPRGSAFHD